MPDRRRAYLFAAAAILLWSTVATAFELALRGLRPLALLAIAAATSALCLALVLAARGRLARLARLRPQDLARGALLGLCGPFAYYWVLLGAYDRLPAQQAQPLNYVWPITLALPVAVGLGLDDYYESPTDGRDTRFGYLDVGLVLAAPIGGADGSFEATLGVHVLALGDATRDWNDGEALRVVFAVGVAVAF